MSINWWPDLAEIAISVKELLCCMLMFCSPLKICRGIICSSTNDVWRSFVYTIAWDYKFGYQAGPCNKWKLWNWICKWTFTLNLFFVTHLPYYKVVNSSTAWPICFVVISETGEIRLTIYRYIDIFLNELEQISNVYIFFITI